MDKFLTMLTGGQFISDICRATGLQACHLCERFECGDNTNPLVQRIKKLEAELKVIQKINEPDASLLSKKM